MVPESDGAHDAGRRAARFNRYRERRLPPHPGPLPPGERELDRRPGDSPFAHPGTLPPRERSGFFICSRLTEPDVRSITPPMILQSRPSFLYKNSGDL